MRYCLYGGSMVKGNLNEGMYCKGTVEGCHVNSIVLDTGSVLPRLRLMFNRRNRDI